ncbi:MAG TPA: carboxypeptidase-like regulatory domain-containing protein [Candidatus Binatus sp.]|nr:carboxypeptidase-like regulatory domain-containing protein [Candidatus Binatus sp.]
MKLFLAPLMLGLLAHSGSAQTPSEKPPACTVQGQVIQEPGSGPMRKVKVQLTSEAQDENVAYSVTTDAEGKFNISDIKPGPYRLSAEHSGFFLVDQKLRTIRSETLTLRSGDALSDFILRMQPAGVITGKVLDRDGDPMPSVTVTATRCPAGSGQSHPHGFGHTNDQGEYRMANLQPGRYCIAALSTRDDSDETAEPDPKEATKKNKRPERSYTTYYPGSSDRNQAVPIEVRPGDELSVNINMVFGPTFRVRGSVANLPGAADVDAEILLISKDASVWHDSYSAPEIKKDGSFEVRAVPPGLYYLAFKSSSDASSSTAVQTVEVVDSDVENVRVSAVPVSIVHGRLRLESNSNPGDAKAGSPKSLLGFVVALASDETDSDLWRQFVGNMKSLDSSVKPDGTFELANVPAGSYRVSAWAGTGSTRDSFVQSIVIGGKDVTNSGLNISGGNYALDIVMSSEGATMEGSVVEAKDGRDQPVAGGAVIAIPDAARRSRRDLYQSDTADQQGRFKLHGLAPGEYELIALEYLEGDYRDPEFFNQYGNSSQSVRVDKGEHKTIALKVAKAAGD